MQAHICAKYSHMWIPKVIPSYYEKKNIVENSSIIILIIIWRNYLNILLHTPDIKVFLYHITSIHICEHIFTYVSKILIFVSIILTYVNIGSWHNQYFEHCRLTYVKILTYVPLGSHLWVSFLEVLDWSIHICASPRVLSIHICASWLAYVNILHSYVNRCWCDHKY